MVPRRRLLLEVEQVEKIAYRRAVGWGVLADWGVISRVPRHRHRRQRNGVSPHHRFVIALHSPDGVTETGLCVCRPEKNARKPGCGVRRDTFSSAV